MIRAVLFDVGGTLYEVHHSSELMNSFCQRLLDLLSAHGIALPITAAELAPQLHENAEAYKRRSEETRLELPNAKIWSEYYLKEFHLSEELLAPVSEELSWMYDATRAQNVPRPNMQETIRTLHREGLKIGVISNMISTTFVPRLLEDYGIADLMSCVIMSSTVGVRKPDPAIFEKAAAACGVPCKEMAYVGDTLSRDVLGSRNAGVALSIQISNPSAAKRDAAFVGTGLAPDALIHDLAEIPGIIRDFNAR